MSTSLVGHLAPHVMGSAIALRMLVWPIAGATVGIVCWGGEGDLASLTALLALPVLWARVNHRACAALLMLAYFLAGSRGLPGGSAVFFGDTAPTWWGACLWLAAGAVLTLPYLVAWSVSPLRKALGFVLAMVATALPPIGIVGWLNPLTMAGVLFPGMGWVGVLLTLAVMGLLAYACAKAAAAMVLVAVAANACFIFGDAQAREPQGWLGFNTQFPALSSGTTQASQLLASMARIQWVRQVAADMPNDATLVLPETVLGRFDGVTQSLLDETESLLRAKQARVLVGAEMPIQQSRRYVNAVVVLGAQTGDSRAAEQGIPVPISMWKPWADDGAEADLLARRSVINIGTHRVGAVVCYEQLLTYSMLLTLQRQPSVLIAVSNVWWARSTNIPAIQEQSARAYARLFNVPLITARNI